MPNEELLQAALHDYLHSLQAQGSICSVFVDINTEGASTWLMLKTRELPVFLFVTSYPITCSRESYHDGIRNSILGWLYNL